MNARFLKIILWKLTVLIVCFTGVFCDECARRFPSDAQHKRACFHCVDICRGPRGASICLEDCLAKANILTRSVNSVSRVKRDEGFICQSNTCGKNEFCDKYAGGCSSCDLYCKNHHVQGTTKECENHCPDVYKELLQDSTAAPVTARKETTAKDVDTEINKQKGSAVPENAENGKREDPMSTVITIISVTLAIIVIILGIFCVVNRTKIFRCFAKPRPPTEEEKKLAVPCSEESDVGSSKTPLTKSSGPIKQEETPQTSMASRHLGELGQEYGFRDMRCSYSLIDGNPEHLTAVKQCY